jgi:hypothetical protein
VNIPRAFLNRKRMQLVSLVATQLVSHYGMAPLRTCLPE